MFGYGDGGIEQAFLNTARLLEQEGRDVTHLTHPRALVNPPLRQAVGDRLLHCGNRNLLDPIAWLRLYRLVRRQRPELILAHGNRAIRLLRRVRGGARLVAMVHNERVRHSIGCDGVICVSNWLRELAVQSGQPAERAWHVPNVLSLQQRPPEPRSRLRQPLWIGSLGRLVDDKGYDLLLRAVASLQGKLRIAGVRIGGEGPARPKLERLASDLGVQLELPGWIERRESFLRGLDLFCLPSRRESFGMALTEAMWACVPTLASDTQGPCEITENGRLGYIFRQDDVEDLADTLYSAVERTNNTLAMATLAQSEVVARYSDAAIGERLRQVLGSLD